MVGWPYRMSGSCLETLPDVPEGWEAIPDVRQLSGGLPGCPGVFGRPSRMSERPTRMPWSGQETLPDVPEGWEDLPEVREALPVVREWSEAFPNVREWLGIYPRCPGGTTGCLVVVGWHFRMSGSCREAIPDIREGFPTTLEHPQGSLGHLGGFPDYSRTSGMAS